MARQVNYVKDIVDNYTTEEIISFVSKGLSTTVAQMNRASGEQNLCMWGNIATTTAEIYAIVKELDKKLNGDKTQGVL